MTSKPHPMFEDCLAVREVLQTYAPIVPGFPVHEGEAAMGRIEEQYAIAVDERDKAQEARRYLRGARDRLKEQLETAQEKFAAARNALIFIADDTDPNHYSRLQGIACDALVVLDSNPASSPHAPGRQQWTNAEVGNPARERP